MRPSHAPPVLRCSGHTLAGDRQGRLSIVREITVASSGRSLVPKLELGNQGGTIVRPQLSYYNYRRSIDNCRIVVDCSALKAQVRVPDNDSN